MFGVDNPLLQLRGAELPRFPRLPSLSFWTRLHAVGDRPPSACLKMFMMYNAMANSARRESYERPPANSLRIDGGLYGPRDDAPNYASPPPQGAPQNYAAYPRALASTGPRRSRPAAPRPPSSDGSGALSAWAEGLRAEFFAADAEICNTPDPAPAAVAATHAAVSAGQALERAKRRLHAARVAMLTAREEEASSSGFTKHFRRGTYEERKAELDKQRAVAAAEVDSAIRGVSAADDAWRAAEAERVRLTGLVRRRKLAAARRWEVLDDLFAGRAGDAAENAAEHAREAAVAHKQQVAAAMQNAGRAMTHAARATDALTDVVRLLLSASSANTMDMYSQGNYGMGGMAQQQVHANLARAGQLAEVAAQEAQAARQLSPGMPPAPAFDVHQSQFSMVMSMMRDSTFSDFRQRMKIQKALAEARGAVAQSRRAQEWQETAAGRVRADLAAAESAVNAAQERLLAERVRLIRMPV